METVTLILTILQVISSLGVIVTVMFQSGKDGGMGALTGGSSDTFFGRNKGRSLDAKLEKGTKVFGASFILLTLILLVL